MKTNKFYLIPLLLFLLSAVPLFAQDVEFTYDLNGNRENRIIDMSKSSDNINDSTNINDEKLPKIYTETLNNHTVTIFPNPSEGAFQVKIEGLEDDVKGSLTLTSLSGIVIYKLDNIKPENNIDIRNTEGGTYFLSIILNDQKSTWKVIKK